MLQTLIWMIQNGGLKHSPTERLLLAVLFSLTGVAQGVADDVITGNKVV